MDKLPEGYRYRLVFVLREMESLATAETANAWISEENVKIRLHRSRTLLRTAPDPNRIFSRAKRRIQDTITV